MSSFEAIKSIDTNTKDTVNGYLREIQSLLSSDNIYYTIPTLVSYWCLLYFYVKECFDPDLHHISYETQFDDSMLIKKQSNNSGSAYLKRIAKPGSGVHCWKFRFVRVDEDYYTFTLGIWKMNYPIDAEHAIRSDLYRNKAYGWMCVDESDQVNLTKGDGCLYKDYGETTCKQGDIVEMVLDLDQFTLRYIRNGEDLGIAFENIEVTEYVAAISMYRKGDAVELSSYQTQ